MYNSVLRWKFVKFDNLFENFMNFEGEVVMDLIEIKYVKIDWNVVLGEIFNVIVKLYDEVGNLVLGIIDIVIKFFLVYFNIWLVLFFMIVG